MQAISVGICSVCTGPFASKLAPTGERISRVGAGLLAKAPDLTPENLRHKKTRTSHKARVLSRLQAINAPAGSAACGAAVRPRPTAVGRRR
ncbi:hypothetical protein C3E98_019395 [Pseudomonas sp. MWU13-2625]|nr:hypothetical protein C3E98_019395 [Pseudomonas sp. MWU13-2625]